MVEGQVSQLVADTLGFPGAITRVDFRVDGALLGTATAAPFTFLWFPLPAGTFTITATAYDDRGTVATSTPVHLIVRPRG
jgi:chitinase